MVFSEIFWTSLYISGFGFLGAVLAVCYKSKCKTIECCCIKINRDVELEEKVDEMELQRPNNETTHDKPNNML
jgi:hypothetical protein